MRMSTPPRASISTAAAAGIEAPELDFDSAGRRQPVRARAYGPDRVRRGGCTVCCAGHLPAQDNQVGLMIDAEKENMQREDLLEQIMATPSLTQGAMQVKELVLEAFDKAWHNKEKTLKNKARSSYFVSELAMVFAREFNGKPLVQETDENGNKQPGEWLLDIAIVSHKVISTQYKGRTSKIVDKVLWAIESELSTELHEFCVDFSKLLHIKADRYLYIAGLNQSTRKPREDYIAAQQNLAMSLVTYHNIVEPFYLVFVPTPGKTRGNNSIWDTRDLDELKAWVKIADLSNHGETLSNNQMPPDQSQRVWTSFRGRTPSD
jgi:hypothetical protein